MKMIPFLLFISLSINSFGQIENIKKYLQDINSAELNLIAGNRSAALNNYYTILTRSEGNFCKDIYNAMLLSAELSKPDTFFVFLNLLQKKGLSNSYINDLKEFEQFHHSKKWDAFLKTNQNHPLINKVLRADMDSLLSRDQFYRVKEGAYKIYGDSIKQIDSLNMLFIYSLISRDKFPGEDEIGVYSIAGRQGYDIVLHHYTQQASLNKKLNKITPLLENLVLQGKILPNKCAHWLEMQSGEFKAGVFDIMGFKIAGKPTRYFRPIYGETQKLTLNEYRKLLCAESLEDYYKKFAFVIKNPASKYCFDVSINNFEVDENTFTIVSETMTEIK